MKYAYALLNRSITSFLSHYESLGSRVQPIPTQLTYIGNHFSSTRLLSSTPVWNKKKTQPPELGDINPILLRHPERDRSKVISVETSISYLKSAAFKEAYGNSLVWHLYRRNHKGLRPPQKTRKLCIRADIVATGNPCPICRDEYLVVDYRNLDLLQQFISPITGKIISYEQTGVCQKQHKNLLVAHEQAKDLGLIAFDVPYRSYDYSEYEP